MYAELSLSLLSLSLSLSPSLRLISPSIVQRVHPHCVAALLLLLWLFLCCCLLRCCVLLLCVVVVLLLCLLLFWTAIVSSVNVHIICNRTTRMHSQAYGMHAGALHGIRIRLCVACNLQQQVAPSWLRPMRVGVALCV